MKRVLGAKLNVGEGSNVHCVHHAFLSRVRANERDGKQRGRTEGKVDNGVCRGGAEERMSKREKHTEMLPTFLWRVLPPSTRSLH
ncbi:hypothetical protein WN55_09961 [Dufourea novaeangliae]|uniref:Uncharacterized protein n=1 Tax=Dufourea novaeangliae TaxID=178035 RepID=A0A154P7L1_DUFNO|nr:hypothetical protein WN55_09961 [Dufourea novaeangliae]